MQKVPSAVSVAETGGRRALLLLLWVIISIAQHQQAAATVQCNLIFLGHGYNSRLTTASLVCNGGTITAAANPAFLGPFKASFSGVKWSTQGACGTLQSRCVLTICGSSSATFSASRVEKVNVSTPTSAVDTIVCLAEHSRLIFEGATFKQNYGRPVASYNDSVLIIHSSKFLDNTAVGAQPKGGAVFLGGTSADLSRTTFAGNSVAYSGGAVAAEAGAKVNITKATFRRNTGLESGGAVYAGPGVSVRIHDCEVTANTGGYAAGLVVLYTASVAVSDSHFSLNKASESGGALYVSDHGRLDVTNSLLVGNTAKRFAGGLGLYGYARVHVSTTRFIRNVAAECGAVGVGSWSHLVLHETLLHSNAAGQGGALCTYEDGVLNMSSTTISNNTATRYGGGFFVDERSKLYARNCTMVHNTAVDQDGGGMYVQQDSTVTLLGSKLLRNKAARGGAISIWGNVTCTIDNCRVTVNRAATSGGGLLGGGAARLVLRNSSLLSNTAGKSGGGLLVAGSVHVDVASCRSLANSATGNGGAIHLQDRSQVNITRHTMGLNNSADEGGFLYLGGTSLVDVEGAILSSNKGTRGGMVAAAEASYARFRNCQFVGMKGLSNTYGGAFNLNHQATLVAVSCTFTDFTASVGAGIASFGSTVVQARNCSMANMASLTLGGSLYVGQQSRVTWVDGVFSASQADQGGTAYIAANSSVEFRRTSFVNSSSGSGGALMAIDGPHVVLEHCSMHACTSSDTAGGAVLLMGSAVLNLAHVNITQCSTSYAGGALAIFDNARVAMARCRLQGNSARTNGGGVVVDGAGTLTVDRSRMVHNSCGGLGGGINLLRNVSVVLRRTLVSWNAAASGGGVWHGVWATLTLDRSWVTGNTASRSGGGVVLVSDQFDLEQIKASVHHNQAPHHADIAVMPTKLASKNCSNCQYFVSRLGSDDGLVHVTLLTTGPQGLPSGLNLVRASLDGVAVRENTTGEDGRVQLNVKLRKPPGRYHLQFSLPSYTSVPPVNVTVHVVNCSQGDTTAATGDACHTCDKGYFSFDPRNSTCDTCPSNAVCPGGSVVLPTPGQWHSAPHSVQMHRCFNQEACPGTIDRTRQQGTTLVDYKTAQCADGYMGNICGLCQPGYGVVKPFTCKRCLKPAVTILLYSLAAVVMLVVVRLLSAMALNTSTADADQLRPVDFAKPLVLYAQWLYIVVSLNGVPWPPSLEKPLQALSWFWSSASSNSLGLDCVLPRDAIIPTAVQKVLFGVLMPVGLLVVLMCLELLLSLLMWRSRSGRFAGRRHQLTMCDRFRSLLLCLCYLFLPTWIHTALSLFTCVPLDSPASFPYAAEAVGSFWAQDLSSRCYEGYHRGWALGLGVPLLLVLCGALPAALFVFLWHNGRAGRLRQNSFMRQYGFLYRTWEERVCWWESVVVLQTITLVLISTFGYVLGPYYQSLVLLAALGLSCALLLSVKPHACAAGTVAQQSAGVLCLTSFSALTFLPHRNVTPPAQYTMAIGVLVLVGNVAFVASALWKLLSVVEWGPVRRLCAWCRAHTLSRCACASCIKTRPDQATHASQSKAPGAAGLAAGACSGLLACMSSCCSRGPAQEGSENSQLQGRQAQSQQDTGTVQGCIARPPAAAAAAAGAPAKPLDGP